MSTTALDRRNGGSRGDADLWIGAGEDEEGVSLEEVDGEGETGEAATTVELELVIPFYEKIADVSRTTKTEMFQQPHMKTST